MPFGEELGVGVGARSENLKWKTRVRPPIFDNLLESCLDGKETAA